MNKPSIELDQRPFFAGRTCVIGEVAQAHDGSLGAAHAFIDAIADAGADGVKFQTHIAAAESTPGEPWRIKFSKQDNSRYEYWQRMEFSAEQWVGLKEHADQRGLLFFSSPFSTAAVDLLDKVGVAAWKVASGEMSNPVLFEAMAATRRPFLLSTGMSDWAEIDRRVNWVRDRGLQFAVMQCTSMYPTPPEKVGLELLSSMGQRYGCPVGLSDHSGTIFAGLAAATLGAALVEVHVAFHRKMFGPDTPASITVDELAQLVSGTRFVNRSLGQTIDKNAAARELAEMRRLFTRSIVAAKNLPLGEVLRPEHVVLKKPGTGLQPERLPELLGRRLRRAVAADEFLHETDLE